MGEVEDIVIRGIVGKIIYSNDNGFHVLTIAPEDGDPLTAVGTTSGVLVGDTISMKGKWEKSKKYGSRFRFHTIETLLPKTTIGIRRFLSSGRIEGIGEELAERIVSRFGEETLEIVDESPERLLEVDGIGKVRLKRIMDAWAKNREMRDIRVFLHNFGIASYIIEKIISTYKEGALKVLKENPYRVAEDVRGIGFLKADEMAGKLGISRESPARARGVILYILKKGAEEGHCFLPYEEVMNEGISYGVPTDVLLKEIEKMRVMEDIIVSEISEEGEGRKKIMYLPSFYWSEKGLSDHLVSLMRHPPSRSISQIGLKVAIAERTLNITLSPDQRRAVENILASKVAILTGGPGTGKTTIITVILKVMEKEGLIVRLAAPTGRASRRLSEASGAHASTIHRLLEYNVREKGFTRNKENPIDADMVVVDESSMIDIFLMNSLISAIPKHARFVLVGDAKQLPPVGPGRVFKDLCESNLIPVFTLTQIHRQKRDSLTVVNAHRVNMGLMPLRARRRGGHGDGERPDFYFIERETPEDVLSTILTLLTGRIEKAFPLDPKKDIQVLTPIHHGILGSINLNREIQKVLNPEGREFTIAGRNFRVGDRVLQTRNNYDLEIFNGDTGKIVSFEEKERRVNVDFYDRFVQIKEDDTLDLEPGYAISVHKAQGSEYPSVIIPVVFHHYIMLRRNLIYTAITRGKDLVILVGQMRALATGINNDMDEKRWTSLKVRLREAMRSGEEKWGST